MRIAIFIFIGLAIATALVLQVRRKDQKHREAVKQMSHLLGMDYQARPALGELMDPKGLALFLQGREGSRKVRCALIGSSELMVLEYSYTTDVSAGKSHTNPGGSSKSDTHRQTVSCFKSSRVGFPEFQLCPRTIDSRILSVSGHQDINFDSHPDFSEAYVLRGSDEAAIRKLFSSSLLDHLVRSRGLSVEGSANRLIVYRAGTLVTPEDLSRTIEDHRRVYELFTAGE